LKTALKYLKKIIKEFEKEIKTYKYHKPILSVFATLCIFLIVIMPLYDVYSVEKTPYMQPTTREVLGNESYGFVIKEGPYGNSTSKVKVAYIVGQHPREHFAHEATVENVKEQSPNFRYCYYLYYINVTSYTDDFAVGRMNGQILSNSYVVPDITKENFDFAVDVHGTDGEYSKRVFLFTPLEKGTSLDIAFTLTNIVDGVPYYHAPNPSSTEFTTIPLINNGIPAIVYESFTAQPYDNIKKQDKKFVLGVDNLNFYPNPCY
jgi:hypothetical protein